MQYDSFWASTHKKALLKNSRALVYFVGGSSCLCRKYLLMSDTADKRQYITSRTFIMRWTGCATLISKPPISYHIRKHLSIVKCKIKSPAEINRAETSISSAGSQDTQDICDLCPNTADKLWYIWSFDTFIVAHLPAFVNTKTKNKKPCWKTAGLKCLFCRLEAAALLRKNKLLMSELSRLAEIYQVY